MTLVRRRIAQRLVEAQHAAALLTTFNEVDMAAVIELRKRYREAFEKQYGARLGFMSFFVKASIEALKLYPALNAMVREANIVYRNYYDIGVAVAGGKILVTPVLRDADRMSFAEIERAIADFSARVAANSLKPDELSGGTFTITNGGVFGSLLSTPIVNPPQSGILGMHAIQDRPVAARRPSGHSADDVPRADLRPSDRRRPRGGGLPAADQGDRRGARPAAAGSLTRAASSEIRITVQASAVNMSSSHRRFINHTGQFRLAELRAFREATVSSLLNPPAPLVVLAAHA